MHNGFYKSNLVKYKDRWLALSLLEYPWDDILTGMVLKILFHISEKKCLLYHFYLTKTWYTTTHASAHIMFWSICRPVTAF